MSNTPIEGTVENAFRLVMNEEGTAPVGLFMAAWSLMDFRPDRQRTMTDLPEGYNRRDDVIVTEAELEPIVLTPDEVIMEAFRLERPREQPGGAGWNMHSNIVRAGKLLATHTPLLSSKGDPTTFAAYVRDSVHVEESSDDRSTLFVRLAPNGAGRLIEGRIPVVRLTVTCPGDEKPRDLGSFAGFGQAGQHLLRISTVLTADGTRALLDREGDVMRTAVFDAVVGIWRTPDGSPFRRIDPNDVPMHDYANGHLVGGLIGYVTEDRRGRFHACVGEPHDSHGDDDASIGLVGRRQADSVEDALAMLRERGDLDHVFTRPTTINMMGAWLTTLKDEPETKA